MGLSISQDLVPITIDTDGVARVGGTRVRLDTVITAFKLGATAEEIALDYDALCLADVYAAIAYYLRHTAEVDEYLHQRELETDEIRREIQARFPTDGLRERLLARAARQHSP